jgi:hypothetical protein
MTNVLSRLRPQPQSIVLKVECLVGRTLVTPGVIVIKNFFLNDHVLDK